MKYYNLARDIDDTQTKMLTWPMAKLQKLFGIRYFVDKIKFKLFFFRVHWLSENGRYVCVRVLHANCVCVLLLLLFIVMFVLLLLLIIN